MFIKKQSLQRKSLHSLHFNKVKTIYICNVDLQKGQPSHKQGRVIVSIKLKDTFDILIYIIIFFY